MLFLCYCLQCFFYCCACIYSDCMQCSSCSTIPHCSHIQLDEYRHYQSLHRCINHPLVLRTSHDISTCLRVYWFSRDVKLKTTRQRIQQISVCISFGHMVSAIVLFVCVLFCMYCQMKLMRLYSLANQNYAFFFAWNETKRN